MPHGGRGVFNSFTSRRINSERSVRKSEDSVLESHSRNLRSLLKHNSGINDLLQKLQFICDVQILLVVYAQRVFIRLVKPSALLAIAEHEAKCYAINEGIAKCRYRCSTKNGRSILSDDDGRRSEIDESGHPKGMGRLPSLSFSLVR